MCTNEKFYVLERDGSCIKFEDYDALLKWLSGSFTWGRRLWDHRDFRRIEQCGNNWNDTYMKPGVKGEDDYWWRSIRQHVKYIVYDYTDRVINVEYLKKDLEDFVPKKRDPTCWGFPPRWAMRFRDKGNYIFRHDPVPGTGGKRWHFRSYYKAPRTTQERKLYGDLDHRIHGRGKRYPCNLPNSWDDRGRSDIRIKKNWKKVKKKKQWM